MRHTLIAGFFIFCFSATSYRELVACGWEHTYILDVNGTIFSCGRNNEGQLGVGGCGARNKFVIVLKQSQKFVAVAAGVEHGLALDENGNLWTLGSGGYGQLGFGELKSQRFLTKIEIAKKFIFIAAGSYHSLALDENGTIWSFGANYCGQLGLGDKCNRAAPEKVKIKNVKFKFLSAGESHSLALDMDGTIWSFGENNSGELGFTDLIDRNIPEKLELAGLQFDLVSAGYYYSLALDNKGNQWFLGIYGNEVGLHRRKFEQAFTKIKIKNTKFRSIAAGRNHCLALDMNNNLWSFGSNSYGQLGHVGETQIIVPKKIEIENKKFVEVYAGDDYCFALDEEGFLYSFGRNNAGQLGLKDHDNIYEPYLVPVESITRKFCLIKSSRNGSQD